ncbi:hypothetical protein SAMN05518801_101338 [Novosphingobium sp. CF614]|uniref:hypothetical protein n=1 Tax=Novosphingobium sp. CF614 TaxID=1884364 RepID=UPI0008E2516F|nr:hypothetical protein [Novosphingobium sp. CF614]SFF76394.1 hypothetical protein SAMN05518801_101338 [Novosphingobium sp. CF614]
MSRVRIEVGELVFHGLDRDAAQAAGAAFSAELERLVTQRGIGRPAPAPRLSARPGPADLGRAAAARVHARIARGASV